MISPKKSDSPKKSNWKWFFSPLWENETSCVAFFVQLPFVKYKAQIYMLIYIYILSNRLKYIWLYYGWTLTCVCSTLEHSNTCNTCFWHWQEIFAKLLLDCHRTWIRSNWGFNQESRNRRIDFDQRRSTRFQSDKAILLRNGTSELHAYNSVPKSFELS